MQPKSGAIFDSRGMSGRIYVERAPQNVEPALHTKHKRWVLVVSENTMFHVFPVISLWQKRHTWAWPVSTLGPQLTGFIKRVIIHNTTQNMNALGRAISEQNIIYL